MVRRVAAIALEAVLPDIVVVTGMSALRPMEMALG